MTPSIPPRDVAIIGAGIVGMSAALHLQQDGHRVTVIDPRPPGTGASFGNAGVIAVGGVMPTSMPGLWKKVPGMLLDPAGPFALRWRHLPRIAPWLVNFLRAGSPERVRRISRELHPLVSRAYDEHEALVKLTGAEGIIRRVGWLKLYGSEAGFAGSAMDRELMTACGVGFQVLDGDEIGQLEPHLARRFPRGVFDPNAGFVSWPHKLVTAYAEHFRAQGGLIRQETVRRLEIGPNGPEKIVTDLGIYPVDRLVIAAGAWSKALAGQVGAPVPLDTERGYHLNLKLPEGAPSVGRPTYIADDSFVLAPMQDGLRLTSGVELAGLDAPGDFTRIRRMLALADRSLPGLKAEVTREWLGFRPSTPDSKPVIGRSPRYANTVLAFGHGHMGLSLGPFTGRLVADLIAGRGSPLDLTPYAADRRFR
ncbi:NAD(P)/FAD-dependent oxidoreductase [Oceanibaculum pacificum]|nr:FAD-dependent oxidoreductase [Oceanibaculum pacificum]